MLKANYDDVSDCKAYLKEQPERERGGGLVGRKVRYARVHRLDRGGG